MTAALLAVALAACATTGSEEASEEAEIAGVEDTNDPLEMLNRGTFALNRGLDFTVIRPAAEFYRIAIPPFGRQRVRNFLNNLRSPVIFANDLLQFEGERAGITLGRFVINSTVGLAGLFDAAVEFGLPPHNEDFGQTLAVWGVGEGPYIMLPLFGPSNVRDAIGMVADLFFDPLNYLVDTDLLIVRASIRGLDLRAENIETIDELEKSSVDFYAKIRTLYRQYRDNEIRNGELPPPIPIPSISFDDLDEGSDETDWDDGDRVESVPEDDVVMELVAAEADGAALVPKESLWEKFATDEEESLDFVTVNSLRVQLVAEEDNREN